MERWLPLNPSLPPEEKKLDKNYTKREGEWIKNEKKEKTLIISFEQLNLAIPEILMIANQLGSLLESLNLCKLGFPDGWFYVPTWLG